MFKRSCNLFLLAGVLVLMAAASAAAGNRPFAFTLTPQAGTVVFEGNQKFDPALTGGLALGYNFDSHWGAEGVLTLGSTEATGSGGSVDLYAYHLDLLYLFRPQQRLIPYLSLALGGIKLGDDEDLLGGYGVGLKYFISENVALRLDLKHLLDINYQDSQNAHAFYNMLAATAGVSFQFGGEKLALLVNDSDVDGIVDAYDRCPGSSRGVMVDGSGCPLDADLDGVDDRMDHCPDTLGSVEVNESGCPALLDEVLDKTADRQTVGSGTSVQTLVAEQSSLDRVTFRDPVPLVEELTKRPEPVATFNLEFRPNKAEVSTGLTTDMQKMVSFIKANPGRRFIIEGYTDSVGNEADNMQLSLLRAEKITVYLIRKMGVNSSLLEARGFGESHPVADNETSEGRSKNRRVVIKAITASPDTISAKKMSGFASSAQPL